MDADHPEIDQQWDARARHENVTERLDRNWASLLQELRVLETGVQLLTGLLLTLPFQQRFIVLDHPMRLVYLATVACSVVSTVLLVAPVGMHRVLFRRHRLAVLVAAAHRLAFAGLLSLGLAMVGVTDIVFDTVSGRRAGIASGAVALVAFSFCWLVLPLILRSRITSRTRRGPRLPL
ncbi:DUF6328 family protein [Mycobacteroides chelonae]|uniref:DUF6328 family protein n=1 Tax=Mycobacteroides chelonae TaxID=1774 RepID=UPI000991E40F|nr:DUF6328 family protein [Mycobacteroides chelonae]